MQKTDVNAKFESESSRRARDPRRFIPWLRERNAVFARMSDAEVNALFRHAEVRKYSRGTVAQPQAEPAENAFVVIDGTLTVRVTNNGIVRELFSYEQGEIAGLMSFVDEGSTPYEVYSATNTEIICINVKRVAQLRAAYHPTGLAILGSVMPLLIEHLQELDKRALKLAKRKNASTRGSGETFRRGER
jgi:CRP-like cAMP-binding protein